MEILKVGLIGTGGMGVQLAQSCHSLPNAKITAVCDVVEDSRDKAAAEFGASAYSDYKELIDNGGVDAVIIATPNFTHREVTVYAAQAGKHLYGEKPMALNVKECDEMIAAAESAGVVYMIGQVVRVYKPFKQIAEIIKSGILGEPFAAFTARLMGTPAWATGTPTWRTHIATSGPILMEVNAHELDYMRSILGEAVSVCAQISNYRTPEVDYEDNSFVEIKFQSGAVGVLHSSIAHSVGGFYGCIQCKEGTLVHEGFAGKFRYCRFGEPEQVVEVSSIEAEDPYLVEIRNFVNAVMHGEKLIFDCYDGRAAIELAEAAMRASETGALVYLPLQRT